MFALSEAAELVPRLGRQPIEMDVVWIVEAIAPILLDLLELDELVAFRRTEQKVPIVFSDLIL